MAPLDAFDLKILRILQRSNLTSQRDIAEQVGLSAAAVHRRMQKLHAADVIAHDVSVISPEHIGRPITLIVEVSIESEKIGALNEVKRTFSEASEVQQCYYVTGEADFILVVTARDMAEYKRLTERLFFRQKNIKRFRTFVAMARVKTTMALPI